MDTILDAHCHLADPRLYPDLDGALVRAADAAVGTIVAVGAIDTIETDRLTVEIAERHPHVFAAVGVHPHNAADCDEPRIAAIAALARSPKVVAIGETGLDFHYMHSPADAQERALRRHLELARAARSSGDDSLPRRRAAPLRDRPRNGPSARRRHDPLLHRRRRRGAGVRRTRLLCVLLRNSHLQESR